MSTIAVLPDHVANQIAAGEVVQRPASVVKELLENSLDAHATAITLSIVGAGKTSILVLDNGDGMDERDAELCFLRHATSKIKTADDLFNLHTRGFRGEAMASIAAVAHVHLKTALKGEAVGRSIKLEGGTIVQKEPWAGNKGTLVEVNHLFYNVPARRKFLKADKIELRHIIDEFHRVALVHTQVEWTLKNEGQVLFHLKPENFRKRIVSVFGRKFDERLVPIKEETDVVRVEGFVIKPQFAKRTRGEQFFFVNDRYIRDSYLHAAIKDAFSDVLSADHHPGYFLNLHLNPAGIDVNIHPTKTEVKFEDERAIYAILRSAARHAIGQFNVAPSLDFDSQTTFSTPSLPPNSPVRPPSITVDPTFNPFDEERKMPRKGTGSEHRALGYGMGQQPSTPLAPADTHRSIATQFGTFWDDTTSEVGEAEKSGSPATMLLWGDKAITTLKENALIIDLKAARFRILYDELWAKMNQQSVASQQLLFPIDVHLSPSDTVLLQQFEDALTEAGFDLRPDKNPGNYELHGIPTVLAADQASAALEDFLEVCKTFDRAPEHNTLLAALAKSICQSAARNHLPTQPEALARLREQLLSSSNPQFSPNGKRIIFELHPNALEQLL